MRSGILFQISLTIILLEIAFGCSPSDFVTKDTYAIDNKLLPFFKNFKFKFLCNPKSYLNHISNYVKFYHYTQWKQQYPNIIEINNNRTLSNWRSGQPVRIFIHGFLDGADNYSPPVVREAYLKYKTYNFIVVDWSKISKSACYELCVNKVNLIGKYTAEFIKYLLKSPENVKLSDIQLIGHSLGAHIAGAAGHHMGSEKIPIIYGLDPAGPLFRNVKPELRLDPTDAEYVEVIHTDAQDGYGIDMSVGHVDFYVNGGQNQPACIGHSIRANMPVVENWLLPHWVKQALNMCSHLHACTLFAKTLEIEFTENRTLDPNIIGYWGYKCGCVKQAFNKLCSGNQPTKRLGAPPDNKNYGIYYLTTYD